MEQGKQKEYQISRWERRCNLRKIDGSPYYEVAEIYEREIRPPEMEDTARQAESVSRENQRLLVSHEPEFYEEWVDSVWNIERWTTKIV